MNNNTQMEISRRSFVSQGNGFDHMFQSEAHINGYQPELEQTQ